MPWKISFLIIAVCAVTVGYRSDASAIQAQEERFGPWKYYAPYYFPRNNLYAGPESQAPVYEAPNPIAPGPPLVKSNAAVAGPRPGNEGAGDYARSGRVRTSGSARGGGGSLDPRPRMTPSTTPTTRPPLPPAHRIE
jgi:hypothetical protein